ELDGEGKKVGIDDRARVDNIAEHGGGITKDQVGKVWADLASLATERMAGGAIRLLAEENGFAALPIAAGRLGGGRARGCRHGSLKRRPRKHLPIERQRPGRLILIGLIKNYAMPPIFPRCNLDCYQRS